MTKNGSARPGRATPQLVKYGSMSANAPGREMVGFSSRCSRSSRCAAALHDESPHEDSAEISAATNPWWVFIRRSKTWQLRTQTPFYVLSQLAMV